MSQQQIPLSAEMIFEMFRQAAEETKEIKRIIQETNQETDRKMQETDRQMQETKLMFQETDRKMQETAEQMKRTDKKISELGSRVGEIVENMVGGDIVGQFQALGIAIKSHSRYKTFGTRGTSESGEIDVFLENGDIVILIEVKTRLTEDEVREHIERMKKYRSYGDDKRRIIGAVAGAVVSDDVIKFAHKQGLYVIVQSGEAVEIIAQPEGFVAKEI